MHVSVYTYIICPQAYDAYICLPLSLALTLPARLFVCPSVCVCLAVYLSIYADMDARIII